METRQLKLFHIGTLVKSKIATKPAAKSAVRTAEAAADSSISCCASNHRTRSWWMRTSETRSRSACDMSHGFLPPTTSKKSQTTCSPGWRSSISVSPRLRIIAMVFSIRSTGHLSMSCPSVVFSRPHWPARWSTTSRNLACRPGKSAERWKRRWKGPSVATLTRPSGGRYDSRQGISRTRMQHRGGARSALFRRLQHEKS